MVKHKHGGDVYHYQNCIDFSANCNPLGTPESVKAAAIKSLERISDYPQVGYGPLKEAIAGYEEVASHQVICGNGAAELIFSLCRAIKPKHALLAVPTFAEYEQALQSVDCQVEHFLLWESRNFRLGHDFCEALDEKPDMVFLCNPNNPTGMLSDRELLLEILRRCKESGIFLVVDECFLDFVKKPEQFTLKPWLEEFENLFLLKAFTKRYAMAGIRLGYGLCSSQRVMEQIEGVTQPWNISSIAAAAGIAALKEKEYVETGRKLVFEQAAYLKAELIRLGLVVFDSQANYIFFKGPEDLFEKAASRGILIRDCSNYPGLCKGYYRIAVKKQDDNKKLINIFSEILKS